MALYAEKLRPMNLTIKSLLEMVSLTGATDLYVMTGTVPTIRFRGEIVKLNTPPLTAHTVEQMVIALLPDDQKVKFAKQKFLEVTLNTPQLGRFKLVLSIQQNRLSMSLTGVPGEGTREISKYTIQSTAHVSEAPLLFTDDEEDEVTQVMDLPLEVTRNRAS